MMLQVAQISLCFLANSVLSICNIFLHSSGDGQFDYFYVLGIAMTFEGYVSF